VLVLLDKYPGLHEQSFSDVLFDNDIEF